ncbi:hypothetical protein SAMN02745687_00920 [Lachnospiraceae bacterium NK3A20]|nr:hypothetical protein SAMN02745687_00920 [Lachnospiraceae bacterium NK3A20]
MLKGITVKLHVKQPTGTDDFGAPTYTDEVVSVDNVLVGQPSESDIITGNQFGKHIAYTLGIPKTDSHSWEDTEVEFWGKKFRTVGMPAQGIEEMVPLAWGRNIMVELYE